MSLENPYELSRPLQGGPIYLAVVNLLNSPWFGWFNWGLLVTLTILFFAYCRSKEGRDEHGRAIIGTSCLYGTVVFFILLNVLFYWSTTVILNLAIFSNSVRLVYNGFMLSILISIAILRKVR